MKLMIKKNKVAVPLRRKCAISSDPKRFRRPLGLPSEIFWPLNHGPKCRSKGLALARFFHGKESEIFVTQSQESYPMAATARHISLKPAPHYDFDPSSKRGQNTKIAVRPEYQVLHAHMAVCHLSIFFVQYCHSFQYHFFRNGDSLCLNYEKGSFSPSYDVLYKL